MPGPPAVNLPRATRHSIMVFVSGKKSGLETSSSLCTALDLAERFLTGFAMPWPLGCANMFMLEA